MVDKLMYIPNDDTQNYPFYRLKLKRLNTQLNYPTNQNSLKPPKFLSQRIRKRYYKTLGTSVTRLTYLHSVRFLYQLNTKLAAVFKQKGKQMCSGSCLSTGT